MNLPWLIILIVVATGFLLIRLSPVLKDFLRRSGAPLFKRNRVFPFAITIFLIGILAYLIPSFFKQDLSEEFSRYSLGEKMIRGRYFVSDDTLFSIDPIANFEEIQDSYSIQKISDTEVAIRKRDVSEELSFDILESGFFYYWDGWDLPNRKELGGGENMPILSFNEDGLPDKGYYYGDYDTEKNELIGLQGVIFFKWASNGKLSKRYVLQEKENSTINNSKIFEDIFDYDLFGTIKTREIYSRNSKGKLELEAKWVFDGNGLLAQKLFFDGQGSFSLHYFRNQNHSVSKIEYRKGENGEVYRTEQMDYLDFDERGNWIKRLIYINDILTYLEIRKIEYND